jgi:two-component system nitrogen regulation sensor histidine kinase NtrY
LNTAGKIRLLLGILFASLLFTAIFVEKTYTPANNLAQTARVLENNLHQKEELIYSTLSDKNKIAEIKSLTYAHPKALSYINEFTVNRFIWFFTFKNNKLKFWSGDKVVPTDLNKIKEGYSFQKLNNGYFEIIKKKEGNTAVVFMILVKNKFDFENKYLQNNFISDISNDKNIDIADFTDKNIYAIHDTENRYLFSLKLKDGKVNNRFFYFQLGIWILTIITLCILIHNIASYLANRKGHVYLALLMLAAFIVLFRFVNLHYGWPSFTQPLKLFDPVIYASSRVYPSLGDLCINILAILWFVGFTFTQRNKLLVNVPGKALSWLTFISCILVLLLISTSLLHLFNGLVINSKISFDINNVLNLSTYSLLGVLMLCCSFLLFILMTEIILSITFKLDIPATYLAVGFITALVLATALTTWYDSFTLFYILWGVIVLIRAYAYLFDDKKFSAASFIGIVLICAIISAINLNEFEFKKEQETRKILIQRLEIPDDITADIMFRRIEKNIIVDNTIVNYFKGTDHDNDYLKTHLQKLYFDRYLSKYDFKVHDFDAQDNPLSADKNYSVDIFKNLVLYSSFKVSDYFYRENESFGSQSYFAILPVIEGSKSLGTIVIELKSKPLLVTGTFPELLIDKDIKSDSEFKDYSYAFYSDNTLVEQSGTFVYSVVNNTFNGDLKKYTLQTTKSSKQGWFDKFTRYSHLVYKTNKRNMIVVSMEQNMLLSSITALTFFFVILLAFGAFIVMVRLLWIRVKIFNINNDRIKWNFNISFDRILYKTRIQFSMIFAVVITLVMVGFITFVSISTQYQSQQDKLIRSKIMQITSALEDGPINNYTGNSISEESRVNFDQLAGTYSTDIILFDLNGLPIITTQPKIYEYGLLSRRISSKAFVALNGQKKSEYVTDEKIGALTYKAAYTPIRDDKHKTVAYLQVPYFSNASDYTEQIGSLLNIMINVYALVFIAIGLFAVIIARQITAPLNFIQYNLSKTIYGKKNEPIKWDRDDEIGALVKEYNNMIAALENSALKLAQSERETAWREMAKQVAHEIKNPLTPLKLGLQLLDKSWKDKDPKFDAKFERFSKSFVEQIESLSNIASEFSAFAKMPDTRIERIDIFDMLTQAVTIFKHMDNVTINFTRTKPPFFIAADRDQLLRCFNNLLKNAIEATPQDTQCLIEINYLITSKNILFTIKDNGNGIPENMREKIFEPNFTTKSSGTGLGLAFVKNSIENANGKVWFETTIGVGTTFYLSFPADDAV